MTEQERTESERVARAIAAAASEVRRDNQLQAEIQENRHRLERAIAENRRQRAILRRRVGWGIVALLALNGAVLGCYVHSMRGEELATAPAEVGFEHGPPETWATDGEEPDAGPIARPMPSGPFKGQKKPPCAKDEATISGACWLELARKPETDACGAKGFEHEGRCYVPVQQAPRPPTSVEP